MKQLTLLTAVILSALIITSCEKSQPKKTADTQTPVTQAAAVPANTGAAATGHGIRPADAEKAPDFSLTDLNGKPFKLSDHLGKVVILDFWATWCPPCKAEIPYFIELKAQYGDKDLVIMGAAMDDINRVKAFYKDHGMNYPVAIANQDMGSAYGGIQGIPTTFVIDKEGYVREKFVGYRPKNVFEEVYLKLDK